MQVRSAYFSVSSALFAQLSPTFHVLIAADRSSLDSAPPSWSAAAWWPSPRQPHSGGCGFPRLRSMLPAGADRGAHEARPTGAVDEQPPQIGIASFGETKQSCLAARGMLPWH